MFRFVRTFAPVVGLLAAFGCSDSTDPGSPTRITDVDVARNAWVSNHPGSYVFDVAISGSMVMTLNYRVTVAAGHVVAATNPNGAQVDGFDTTIDSIWDRVLANRANHQLNAAEFDARGVPIEVDYGPWQVDGGVHYSVRNFSTR